MGFSSCPSDCRSSCLFRPACKCRLLSNKWKLTKIQISHFEKAGAEIDQVQNAPCKESFPTGCSRALTIVKGWYLTMSASEPETEGMQDQNLSSRMDDLLNGNAFHYLDEAYWQNMIAEFNHMTQ